MKTNSKLTSFSTGLKLAAAAMLIVGLAGCASNADPSAMTIAAPSDGAKPFPAQLAHAMCVRNVTGGEETNPLWASKVNNDGFKTALASSLEMAGLSAGGGSAGCSFPVDANLLGLQQPGVGFDMTVTAHVNYKVFQPSGDPLLLATVDSPYTANFSDALVGVERLKKANEGAIRTSIGDFLVKLRDTNPK